MPSINNLNETETPQSGDLLALFKVNKGSDRKIALSTLLDWIQGALSFPSAKEFITQYASPSATGFNISITPSVGDVHLILTPTAGFATGTITLPADTTLEDKQKVLVNCTQQVTALSFVINGATAVTGAPTSLGADDFFQLKYDLPSKTWYRVG